MTKITNKTTVLAESKVAESKVVEKPTIAIIKTAANKIWDDIKDRPLEMFGLPGQTVAKYCSPVFAHPEKLYLTFKVGSVIAALETAFKTKYNFEMADKYIIVTNKSNFPQ